MNTETNYTPGKWIVAPIAVDVFDVMDESQQKLVANVPWDERTSPGEAAANARLIAAAPELLEACKAAVAALSQPVQNSGHSTEETVAILRSDAQAAINILRAAFAKATKGQNQ